MYKEFAIDPDIFVSWRDCQYVTSLFGAEKGRLISRFPAKWAALAYESAQAQFSAGKITQKDLSRIIERISYTKHKGKKIFIRRSRTSKSTRSWIENTINEHHRLPFSSIISNTDNKLVVPLDEIDEIDEPSSPFYANTSPTVDRLPEKMADATGFLFSQGAYYKLIDPYMTKYVMGDIGAASALIAFMERLAKMQPTFNKEIYLFVANYNNSDIKHHNHEKEKLVEILSSAAPKQAKFHIYTVPHIKTHDRYIINEWSGLRFGQGLDSYINGSNSKRDVEISILSEEARSKHDMDFSEDNYSPN